MPKLPQICSIRLLVTINTLSLVLVIALEAAMCLRQFSLPDWQLRASQRVNGHINLRTSCFN